MMTLTTYVKVIEIGESSPNLNIYRCAYTRIKTEISGTENKEVKNRFVLSRITY